MGEAPKQLEPSVCERLKPDPDQLEQDISQYLLLHHDYAAKAPSTTPKPARKHPQLSTKKHTYSARSKLKEIRPKTSKHKNVEVAPQVPASVLPSSPEVLYGTYDESTNCITIIVNDDSVPVDEAITEITTTDVEMPDENTCSMSFLSIPSDVQVKSPSGSVLSDSSDCGYESIDSPHSLEEEEDMAVWDERMSELFPSLM